MAASGAGLAIRPPTLKVVSGPDIPRNFAYVIRGLYPIRGPNARSAPQPVSAAFWANRLSRAATQAKIVIRLMRQAKIPVIRVYSNVDIHNKLTDAIQRANHDLGLPNIAVYRVSSSTEADEDHMAASIVAVARRSHPDIPFRVDVGDGVLDAQPLRSPGHHMTKLFLVHTLSVHDARIAISNKVHIIDSTEYRVEAPHSYEDRNRPPSSQPFYLVQPATVNSPPPVPAPAGAPIPAPAGPRRAWALPTQAHAATVPQAAPVPQRGSPPVSTAPAPPPRPASLVDDWMCEALMAIAGALGITLPPRPTQAASATHQPAPTPALGGVPTTILRRLATAAESTSDTEAAAAAKETSAPLPATARPSQTDEEGFTTVSHARPRKAARQQAPPVPAPPVPDTASMPRDTPRSTASTNGQAPLRHPTPTPTSEPAVRSSSLASLRAPAPRSKPAVSQPQLVAGTQDGSLPQTGGANNTAKHTHTSLPATVPAPAQVPALPNMPAQKPARPPAAANQQRPQPTHPFSAPSSPTSGRLERPHGSRTPQPGGANQPAKHRTSISHSSIRAPRPAQSQEDTPTTSNVNENPGPATAAERTPATLEVDMPAQVEQLQQLFQEPGHPPTARVCNERALPTANTAAPTPLNAVPAWQDVVTGGRAHARTRTIDPKLLATAADEENEENEEKKFWRCGVCEKINIDMESRVCVRCNKPKGRTLDREADAPAVSTDELKVAPRSAFLERKSALPLGSQTPQPGGANQPAKSPPVHSAHSHLHVRQLDFQVATPTSAVPDPNPREALSAPPLCSLSPQPGGAFQPAKRTTPLRSDFSHELVAQGTTCQIFSTPAEDAENMGLLCGDMPAQPGCPKCGSDDCEVTFVASPCGKVHAACTEDSNDALCRTCRPNEEMHGPTTGSVPTCRTSPLQ